MAFLEIQEHNSQSNKKITQEKNKTFIQNLYAFSNLRAQYLI